MREKCISEIDFARSVIDFKVELCQLQSGSRSSKQVMAKFLSDRPVHGQKYGKASSKQVMAKFLSDRPVRGQKFQLHAAVQRAVLFTWPEASTGISHDTLLPILFLGQDGTEPVMTCICLHDEGFGVVGVAKHRGSCQGPFHGLECRLMYGTPMEVHTGCLLGALAALIHQIM